MLDVDVSRGVGERAMSGRERRHRGTEVLVSSLRVRSVEPRNARWLRDELRRPVRAPALAGDNV